ncbi:MAG TPA: type II toxin-antitoxin system Phd/YefM family antitoxin [Rhizomicrobium sp.]|jgi:prevent-host-death family protein|nr:type II toxin-antitoxin system Phd/YefM family antitoxin [Rhizomicrobium sp.]
MIANTRAKKMKELTLRDANQQFSKLVREVAETREEVVVLRNGKAAVKIVPVEQAGKRTLTAAQEAAPKSLSGLGTRQHCKVRRSADT